MMKVKHLFSGMLAMLAVLLLTGCYWNHWNDNPVRTSLEIESTDLVLSVGESVTRSATTESRDYEFTYTSSNPAVATVDQNGKVTAMSEGTAIITVSMPETLKGWYAAASRQYKVIVKDVTAEDLVNVDKATPLTLVAQADGKITVTFNNGITLANDIHYTVNGGAEQTIAKDTKGSYDITVKQGDVVQLYSLNTSLGGGAVAGARGGTRAVDDGAKYINIRPSMKTEIYGNVMSLLKGKDNLESATTIEANNAFYGLFAGAEKLVNNTERLLVLPATTLTEGCYQDMFNGCKGIEKAPELPAPKLEKNCYQEMFYDCAKLNHVKCLATDIKAENSTKDWLGKAGTEATGTKVLETAVPMTANSDDGVPTSWTAAIVVTSVTLDKTELTLTLGDAAVQLKATVAPDNATDKTVTWTSDKPAVATVDATGKVTAVAGGEATITAKAGDKTATCKVTVKAIAVTSITLDKTELALTVGDAAVQLKATVAPDNATDKTVTWTSDKPAVATVDATGKVTAVAEGEATITAKAGDKTATCKVTVTAVPAVIIDLATVTENTVIENGSTVTGKLAAKVKISIADGATVTLDGITIMGVTGLHEYEWAGINCLGDATIILKDGTENTVKGFNESYPGILIPSGKTLTIKGETKGTGTLSTSSNGEAAGIGGGWFIGCGNINIEGGVITASGGQGAAGIGGGYNAKCGDITITTGVTQVTATKGNEAPNSIGAGNGGSCGTVTIGGKTGAITQSPYIYPAPTIGDVGNPIGFDGGGDPLANN